MKHAAINLHEKFALFDEHWSPKIIAQLNDYHLKIAKIQGEFVWHSHAETDEAFIVIAGEMQIELRDREVSLGEGDLFVVPRGVEHRPHSVCECCILLVEPMGTVNTGDVGGELTADPDRWA